MSNLLLALALDLIRVCHRPPDAFDQRSSEMTAAQIAGGDPFVEHDCRFAGNS